MNAKHLEGDETPLCNFRHRNKSVLRSSKLLWVKGQHRIFQHGDFYLTLSVKYWQKKYNYHLGKLGTAFFGYPRGGLGSVSDSSAVTVLWKKKKKIEKIIQTTKQHKCSINPTYVAVLRRKLLCNSANSNLTCAMTTKHKHKDHQTFAYFLLHIN